MFRTARIFGDDTVLGEENNKNQLILSGISNEQVSNDDQLIMEYPFQLPDPMLYQHKLIELQSLQQQSNPYLQLLKKRKGIAFTAQNVIYTSNQNKILRHRVPQMQQQDNDEYPVLLKPLQYEVDQELLDDVDQIFVDVSTIQNPVIASCILVQKISLLGYKYINTEQGVCDPAQVGIQEGLYVYLGAQKEEKQPFNTLLYVCRAACQLLTVLYSNPFRWQKINIIRLQNEQDHEKSGDEIPARKYALTKFFQHYILDLEEGRGLFQRACFAILTKNYSQSAAFLTEMGYVELAVAVAAGQANFSNVFFNDKGNAQRQPVINQMFGQQKTKQMLPAMNQHMLQFVLKGDLEQIIRSEQQSLPKDKILRNWFDVLYICVVQAETVQLALQRFKSIVGQFFGQQNEIANKHFITQILNVYANVRGGQIQPEQVQNICFAAPPITGLIMGQFYAAFNGDAIKFQHLIERLACQAVAVTGDPRICRFMAAGSDIQRRIFGGLLLKYNETHGDRLRMSASVFNEGQIGNTLNYQDKQIITAYLGTNRSFQVKINQLNNDGAQSQVDKQYDSNIQFDNLQYNDFLDNDVE